MDDKVFLDTVWVLMTAKLVFFMNLGFALVESGFARAKNTVNILSKNFIVFAVSTIGFFILGWGLMFGDGNGFVGWGGLFCLAGPDNSPATGEQYSGVYSAIAWTGVPLFAKFFFQLVFCGTAATIVSGVVAERIRYVSFIVFSFFMATFIYPIVGHWVWGGGWLASMGAVDFAGSTVVHSVGGWAGLAGALVLGPRFGKYNANGTINTIPGHSLALATMGTFVLWFGWFGFNPGSSMTVDPAAISHIAVTTNMAAACATASATAVAWVILGKPDLGMTLNGCLAGLVAITAPCAYVSIGSSMLIGLCAGVLVVLAVLAFDRFKIDDPVGALSVHLVNGVFGTLCVGLLAQDGIAGITVAPGLFFGGGWQPLLSQVAAVGGVGMFVFSLSLVLWFALRLTIGVRVRLEEEM